MGEEAAENTDSGLDKIATAMVCVISLGIIVGVPLMGWGYYESQSYTQEFTNCEITDTNRITSFGYRGLSKDELVVRSSCGEFIFDEEYIARIFPGDTVDLTVKYYPGNMDASARVVARAE